MKITILTEGSREIGFGHVMRCFALKEAFNVMNVDAALVIDGDETARAFIGEIGIVGDWLENLSGEPNERLVIVDSYRAEWYKYNALKASCVLLAVIDDFARLDYPANVLMNGAMNAALLPYPVNKSQARLLGRDYLLMRSAFWDAAPKRISNRVETLLVSFGGEDIRNLTPVVLPVIRAAYPTSEILIIFGPGYRHTEMIRDVMDSRMELCVKPDACRMKEVMKASDLCLSAAGLTLYELAACGVPTIAIQVADNQTNNIRGLVGAGFLRGCIAYDSETFTNELEAFLEEHRSSVVRESLSMAGQRLIDGKGALRTAERLMAIYRERQ